MNNKIKIAASIVTVFVTMLIYKVIFDKKERERIEQGIDL